MKNSTIARKLFLRIAPAIVVTVVGIGLFAFVSAKREIDNVYDAQLISDASILWTLVEHELREIPPNSPKSIVNVDLDFNNAYAASKDADEFADSRMFRIWSSGKVVMFSDTSLPGSIPERGPGFSEVEYDHERWRIYTQAVPHTGISIEVGEKKSLRDKLVVNILLHLSFPLLILVPAVGLLTWLGIKSGLGTIQSLVKEIRSRSPDDLSSIPIGNLPRDLSPLGQSINQLLSKLEHSLTAERRFSDDAAHQLRTPLAGLKLQLHMLAEADTESERQALIDDLRRSNDRATHLVEQLLQAARVSHEPISLQPVPLYHATASVIAEMAPVAAEKHLDISLEGNEQACVRADELLIRLMISNLMDNAIKYTPDSGKIRINVLPQDAMWCLSIADTGPGISEREREAVFHRFYRAENSTVEGTGLGLSIVADIVDRFSGSISLNTPETGKGLLVGILIPKA